MILLGLITTTALVIFIDHINQKKFRAIESRLSKLEKGEKE